jgi:hypothetical protein
MPRLRRRTLLPDNVALAVGPRSFFSGCCGFADFAIVQRSNLGTGLLFSRFSEPHDDVSD